MIFKQHKTIDPKVDLILPFQKNEIDFKLISELTGVERPLFDGACSEIRILYAPTGRRVYLLGLGDKDNAKPLFESFRKICHETKKYWSGSIQIDCRHLDVHQIAQIPIGCEMATYKLGVFKSNKEEDTQKHVLLINAHTIADQIEEGKHIGETINRIKTLVDAPANQKTPKHLADWSIQSAKELGYKVRIRDKEALEKEGFGAILAVGGGSINSPYLIETKYVAREADKIDIGLVGKGITFDTGGLSIKPAQNLHYMKSDMGGAAVVLGVVELVAKLKLNVNIIGVVAAAENAVDAKSFRPGDVIDSYSGKSIEIIDTDAEGRLVLADAINYIVKKHNPEHLIDLATLTGSVVRTLGYAASGIFTHNSEMAESLGSCGELVHERVWRLPLFSDYEEDLQSDIADIKNLSAKPIAGASVAAKFIEAFTEEHEKWAHLDIAGMAFGDSKYAKMKCATGYGLRLILEYVKSLEPHGK